MSAASKDVANVASCARPQSKSLAAHARARPACRAPSVTAQGPRQPPPPIQTLACVKRNIIILGFFEVQRVYKEFAV